MTTLVLTVVGDDRAGLVADVADVVSAHHGNWEHSRLAELAGTFAGVIEVVVPESRAAALRAALSALDGCVAVAVTASSINVGAARRLSVTVLGNDRPGIVKDVTTALANLGVGVERFSSETRDAAMSGGRLFEATIIAAVPSDIGVAVVQAHLEELAGEIQVDVSLSDPDPD